MSVEQVKAFFQKVKTDPALAKKFNDAQDSYTGDKSDKTAAFAAIVIPVAAEAGFNFTVEDFKAAFDNSDEGEVSADELDAVAGGDAMPACTGVYGGQEVKTCGNLQFYINFCDAITY
jgi:hypothetical protein